MAVEDQLSRCSLMPLDLFPVIMNSVSKVWFSASQRCSPVKLVHHHILLVSFKGGKHHEQQSHCDQRPDKRQWSLTNTLGSSLTWDKLWNHLWSSVQKVLKDFVLSCFIESVLSFSLVSWFGQTPLKDRYSFNQILTVQTADLWVTALLSVPEHKKRFNDLKSDSHLLHSELQLLPFRWRFTVLRYKKSFIPSAVTEKHKKSWYFHVLFNSRYSLSCLFKDAYCCHWCRL